MVRGGADTTIPLFSESVGLGPGRHWGGSVGIFGKGCGTFGAARPCAGVRVNDATCVDRRFSAVRLLACSRTRLWRQGEMGQGGEELGEHRGRGFSGRNNPPICHRVKGLVPPYSR